MKLEDIDKIYTESLEKYQQELDALGEVYFTKKVLPKILKAARAGKKYIEFNSFSRKKADALEKFLTKHPVLRYDSRSSDVPFAAQEFTISGWKVVKPTPDDVLKKVI